LRILSADEDSSSTVTLPAGTVHQGDYFAMGGNVEISGTVTGDVYVLGGQIFIDGSVKGDVLACGGHVEISGQVENDVRLLAGQASISGRVGSNVTAVGASINLSPSAQIGGNIVCVAGNADIASTVKGEAHLSASFLRLSGDIGKQVFAYVGGFRITSKARIGENLDYRSSEEAIIDPEAKIGGQVLYHPSLVHRIVEGSFFQKLVISSKIAGILMNYFYTFVIGWILLRLFPTKVESALNALTYHPVKALTFGALVLIALPLMSLLLLISILGVPFALTLIAINVATFYTAKIFSIIWASEAALHYFKIRMGRLKAFALGLVVYFLFIQIPYLGFLMVLAALLFGLGAGFVITKKKVINKFAK
jgi:cytoskeletal protein CcmA (bactofilin family)